MTRLRERRASMCGSVGTPQRGVEGRTLLVGRSCGCSIPIEVRSLAMMVLSTSSCDALNEGVAGTTGRAGRSSSVPFCRSASVGILPVKLRIMRRRARFSSW